MTRGRLALAAGAATLAATSLAVVAARHAVLADVSPITPAGAWKTVWVACVTAAVVLSAAGWLLTRSGRIRVRTALVIAVLIQTVPLAGPLLLSKDAYLYWAVGRIVTVHHANPYVKTVSDFPRDPSYPYPSEAWRSYPAAYGPAGETYVTIPAFLADTSARRAELTYRIFAVLGILVTLAFIAWRTRSAGAVALLGWSPLVALHYGGGGHSDAWMTAFLVFAVAMRPAARSGAAWAIAGAFKPVPVILLPLELARARLRLPRRWWAALIGTTLAVAVPATAIWGPHWFVDQARGIHRGAGYPTPLGGVHWLTQLGVSHGWAVLAAGAVFAAIYLVLLRHAWIHGRARFSLAATGLIITSTLVGPWYALWPLALASVEEDDTAGAVAIALSAYLLLADAVHF